MSVLFTAVSVEQQEIVAGGFLNAVTVINANNGAIVVQRGFGNTSSLDQTIVIKGVRTSA